MRTWLLMAFDPDERIYKGNSGYADELRRVYHYDSFVPNHLNIGPGDSVVLRSKKHVLGLAVVTSIDKVEGKKFRQLCPSCRLPKLKERKRERPRFRCECGAQFEVPDSRLDDCIKYSAWFGETFFDAPDVVSVPALWKTAPRLNKQHAMLELDSSLVERLLLDSAGKEWLAAGLPAALTRHYSEGARVWVAVERPERDKRARDDCIRHHGHACFACGLLLMDKYGPMAAGVIDVHHLHPLGTSGGKRNTDPVADLRPLCPNCHRVVHLTEPPMSIEALRRLLEENRGSGVLVTTAGLHSDGEG